LAFALAGAQLVPVLIEVKSHHGTRIDWSEKYLQSLRRFAEVVRLPLLVAWKNGDLWTLVDHEHFEKNVTGYRLSMEKALKEDLFCLLFRNLRIQMNPELELAMDMEILDEVTGGADTLIPEGTFQMKITKAGFYNDGAEIKSYQPEHFSLFLSTPDDVQFVRTGKQTARQIFRPLDNHSFTLSNVLTAQMSLRNTGESVDWHQILAKGSFPTSGQSLRDSLMAGIDIGFIRYVMDIVPQTWPAFFPNTDPRKGSTAEPEKR
jgi:Holliday junction resolvase